MFKVDLFLIGAMKCGTTSLYHLLNQHPDISMSKNKEPAHFLLKENHDLTEHTYRKKWWSVDEYKKLFEPAKILGDASTHYASPPYVTGVARRIFEHNQDAKISYMVRDPVDRIVSHFNGALRAGLARPPLAKEVVRKMAYIGISDYATQLAAYQAHFPPESILVLISERFRADKVAGLRRVEQFLGLPPLQAPDLREQLVTPTAIRRPWIPPTILDRLPSRIRASRLVHGRPVRAASREDVPECVVEYLREKTQMFRTMIGDPITEWET